MRLLLLIGVAAVSLAWGWPSGPVPSDAHDMDLTDPGWYASNGVPTFKGGKWEAQGFQIQEFAMGDMWAYHICGLAYYGPTFSGPASYEPSCSLYQWAYGPAGWYLGTGGALTSAADSMRPSPFEREY